MRYIVFVYIPGDWSMRIYKKAPDIYKQCDQTVTVYHKDGDTIIRKVHRQNAFLDLRKTENVDRTGSRDANAFLLIVRGNEQSVFIGDKAIHGEGPEVTAKEWSSFIPSRVPGLVVVSYADAKRWRDVIVHTEAGG